MAQATPSLSPNLELEHRLHCAIRTIAMQSARNEIRDAIRRQGRKLSLIPSAEINAMAKARLLQHHERLIAEAIPIIEQWLRQGFFGKRAQREWAQRANINTDAQTQSPHKSMASTVQISGAK